MLEERYEGCEVVWLVPRDFRMVPKDADIIFVDEKTDSISQPEIIRELRETHPDVYIIGWGYNLGYDPIRMVEVKRAGGDKAAKRGNSSRLLYELVDEALRRRQWKQ